MIPLKLRLIREQNRIYSFVLQLISRFQHGPEVFLFHDIPEDKASVTTEFALSQASFETFLVGQLASGKKALTHYQLSQHLAGKQKAPKNSFYVTFDDCNSSVFTRAYPFLKQHRIPFLLFITRDLIGKKNFLTAEQIMQMAKDPLCTIGSHAIHHKMFRYMDTSEAIGELEKSKNYLQQLTGQEINSFAFPYGRLVEVSCENIKTLSHSVYDFGFSAIAGNLSQQWFSGKFYLPRINVSERVVHRSRISR